MASRLGDPQTLGRGFEVGIKIIGGDKSDNIPAIFKRGGKKKIMKCYEDKEYFKSLLIKEYGSEELGLDAVKKNKTLIDFNEIPLNLKNEFLKTLISHNI